MTAPALSDSDIDRFWSKVDRRSDGECWLWTGAKRGGGGHGGFGRHYAHRLALFLSTGEWAGGLFVLHGCDVPLCCNPAHLRIGTPADNMRDKVSRGRQNLARGEQRKISKLTTAAVVALRGRYAAGESLRDLAEAYGVKESTAYFAATRRSWAHVP